MQSAFVGSMWGFFFTDREVADYASARTSDTALYARFFHEMLGQGVYLAPSQFESAFVSTAHQQEQIVRTLQAARASLQQLAD